MARRKKLPVLIRLSLGSFSYAAAAFSVKTVQSWGSNAARFQCTTRIHLKPVGSSLSEKAFHLASFFERRKLF